MIHEETCEPSAPVPSQCGLPGFAWICAAHGERGWPDRDGGPMHLWHDRADAEAAYAQHLAERH